MTTESYKVVVVVDPALGERLAHLQSAVPVWILETSANRAIAERLWSDRPKDSHLTGITTFKAAGPSPEENLLGVIDTIDLHHGTYSASPPCKVLEVIGTAATDKIRTELAEYGFNQFHSRPGGFVAQRPVPSDGE